MENQKSKNGFRWNWGVGIALVYVVFVVCMLSMVMMSKNQKIDLVTENYYQQELAFQDEINAQQRVENYNCMPVIKSYKSGYQIDIPNTTGHKIQGTLLAYCPSNKKGDCIIDLPNTESGGWLVNLSKLTTSNYILKFHWTHNGEVYSASLPFRK